MDDDALLAEQLAYYRAGTDEYDRPYAGLADLRELMACVDGLPMAGDVLELACGTGQWTRLLAARARSVTAVDAAAEALALARARAAAPTVEFVEADLFSWQPPRRYWDSFAVHRLQADGEANLTVATRSVADSVRRPGHCGSPLRCGAS